MIQNRTAEFRNDPTGVADQGYWFHYLEDKIAAYLLSVEHNVTAPEIFCCVTSSEELSVCLENNIPPDVDGVVIKGTNFHSSQGVFVLVSNPDASVGGTINLLNYMAMSYSDVVSELSFLGATKIIVEEFIGTSLPTEYKFHVVNGEVAAIDIISDRSGDCPCYAVVDTAWNRLDQFGCFEPGSMESVEVDTGCTTIDFIAGARRAGPVKKDLYVCDDIPELDECTKQEMIDIALDLGERIGVYMRVDMFVADGKVFVQEYTTNHMNGLRHCAAKFDVDTGCIDSCFLGRMWDSAGGPYGGVSTTTPAKLAGFTALTPQQQCDLLIGVQPPSHVSTCGNASNPDVLP